MKENNSHTSMRSSIVSTCVSPFSLSLYIFFTIRCLNRWFFSIWCSTASICLCTYRDVCKLTNIIELLFFFKKIPNCPQLDTLVIGEQQKNEKNSFCSLEHNKKTVTGQLSNCFRAAWYWRQQIIVTTKQHVVGVVRSHMY